MVGSNIIKKVSTAANFAKQQIDDTVKKASDIVDEIKTEAITNDLATRTQNNFSGRNPEDILTDSRLSSTLDAVKKGTSEAETKIKSLAGSSSEALSQPVSFLTKLVKEVMGNAATPMDMLGGLDSPIKGMDLSSLDSLAQRAGLSEAIASGSDLKSALESIAKSVENKISEGTKILADLTESEGLFGSASNIIKNLSSSGLNDAITTAEELLAPVNKINDSINDLLKSGSGLLNEAIGKLPDSISSKIKTTTDSILDDIVEGNKDRMSVASQMISSVMDSKLDLDYVSDVGKLNDLGSSYNTYPKYTDSLGNYVPGISSNDKLTSTQVSKFFGIARDFICNGIKFPDIDLYASKKDLYDLLLMYSGMFGLSDLLNQLLDCADNYHDYRSDRVVREIIRPHAIAQGDPYLYDTIDHFPEIKVTNKEDLLYLNSNMVLKEEDGTGKVIKNKYNQLLQDNNTNVREIVAGERYSGIDSINTTNVVVMSNSNTKVIDEGIGKDTRLLSTQLFARYS